MQLLSIYNYILPCEDNIRMEHPVSKNLCCYWLPTDVSLPFVSNVEHQDDDLEDFKTCAVALAEENTKLKVLTKP
jgi:hypothetical protein